MAELLETVEIETGPAPRAAVVWMHGLGADGYDFVPVVSELALPDWLPVRFVFPHASVRPVTINMGWVMRAWYDVRDDGGERREDEEGVRTRRCTSEVPSGKASIRASRTQRSTGYRSGTPQAGGIWIAFEVTRTA